MSDEAEPSTPGTGAAVWRGAHVPGIDGFAMVRWNGIAYRVGYIGPRPSDDDLLRFVKERYA